eukprot:XP_017951490.1 PREDICTED: uncharacterized protein LOC100488469 isoform X2 [Xenopus tropicalis]
MNFFSQVLRSSTKKQLWEPPSSSQQPKPPEEEVQCVNVLIVGAGSRGKCYSQYAVHFPNRMKVVGVADPRLCTRDDFKITHSIDDDKIFEDWRDAAAKEKFADAVIIATPDRLHKDPAVAFARKQYHIFLEKPMAVTPEDCSEIVSVCKENGVLLVVGHVMRYHPVSREIKALVDSGVIGDIVHIQHMEPVGDWHFAHSFVRGNWRKEDESTFSLLAKSCHDIDLICFWTGKKRCMKVSSFGTLSHFTRENKPKDASSRCMDCSAEEKCPFSAKKIYLKRAEQGELNCLGNGPIRVFDFLTRKETEYPPRMPAFIPLGLMAHGGADYCIMENFISAVANNDPSRILSGPDETLRSHLLVFEAERSRKESTVVHLSNDNPV